MFAIFEFQRVFRGHKGRENAEVQRALKAIEGQTGPLKLKIKRLEKDRDQVGKTTKKKSIVADFVSPIFIISFLLTTVPLTLISLFLISFNFLVNNFLFI